MKDGRKETMACQEVAEAYSEKMEANPEEMKCVAEHEKVPEEEAAVKSFGALKKRCRVGHLAAGHRGKPKERIQGNGGTLKKLAAGRRGMTRRAGVARCKGHSSGPRQGQCCSKNPEKTNVREETLEGPGMQHWHKGPRHEQLRSKREFSKTFRGNLGLEVVK
jgi:hypothetical protein